MVSVRPNEPGVSLAALLAGIERTASHMRAESYRGYDPYDALESPLFRLPVLGSNTWARLAAQQALKRLPLNLRFALGVRKGYNPVTIALALQGLVYLMAAQPTHADLYRQECRTLISELKRLRSPGYSGDCWGYDFPWQSRYGFLPARTPTVVATGFITNALFTAYELAGFEDALPLCVSACDFVLGDLNRGMETTNGFCWSYSPLDRQWVLNASAKGARLCAQVYSVTNDERLLEAATLSLNFVTAHQSSGGAWPYAIGDARGWSDNFHTAYVLDALLEFRSRTGLSLYDTNIASGWGYYRRRFFDGVVPRYYDDKPYPIDATSCAQAMITLCRFHDVSTASELARWSLERLQRPNGAFVYRVYRRYVNKIEYMRWSTAWMFCGLCQVAWSLSQSGTRPLEFLEA